MNKMQKNIVNALGSGKKIGIGKKELLKRVGIKRGQADEFGAAMKELLESGQIVVRKGKYLLLKSLGLTQARIVKVNATFGFAKPEDGGKDVFVAGRNLNGAMPGDKVLIEARPGRDGELPEGAVFSILEEVNPAFSGIVAKNDMDELVIMPDRYVRFPIALEADTIARPGDKILAEVIRRGERHSGHIARLTERFGDSGDPLVCSRAILRAAGISEVFPDEVLEQARVVSGGIHPNEIASRVDLREENIFTIDGESAKDLDDAISLKRRPNGWRLGVHIADVSYYVPHKSALDNEAYKRGTSVYYADRVIPMLPPELSNGICSLHPGEDRLAFSAFIELDQNGKIISFRFEKTVIHSKVRGVYSEVNAIWEQTATDTVLQKYAPVSAELADMRELALLLQKNRFARGSVDLETVESEIVVGADGKVTDIHRSVRGEAERVIEEFMLTANEAAAIFGLREGLPFLYRVHESPDPDRADELYQVLDRLGVKIKKRGKGISPETISAILRGVEDTPIQGIVNNMMLRTMSKARYSDHNVGHFGLALKNYSHFTSPIRRYPDLLIHRIMSGRLSGMKWETIGNRFGNFVGDAGNQSTGREMAAMSAERDCEDCYKAAYMQAFVGHEFTGSISGVTGFGIFVQLDNTVEGLIDLRDFPHGNWKYDGISSYTSENGKLSLGQRVKIKVAAADVSAGRITFVFS